MAAMFSPGFQHLASSTSLVNAYWPSDMAGLKGQGWPALLQSLVVKRRVPSLEMAGP